MRTVLTLAAVLAAGIAGSAAAQDQFFAGKQIELVIGTTPGGGYDTYGRLVARHMGDYIPGKPTLLPKNMPGAGSNKAAAYIYAVAPKDGTSIGAIFPGAVIEPLLGDKSQVQHDSTKFNYLGSANNEAFICIGRSDAPVQKFEDALSKDMIMGASAAGGSTRDFPALLNNVLGTKFNVVSGYPGSKEIVLAVERNEVQGACGYAWSSLIAQNADLLTSGKVRVLAQESLKKHPALDKMGVPLTISFAKTDEQRQILELVYGQLVFGRPYVLPPGVPADRVATLRRAFDATLKDKTLMAEAEKLQLDVESVSGEEVQALVAKMFAAPAAMVERTKQALIYKPR
ncbi:MAG: Bug family tripartite tricarboxylate transporter substrate binding protein [Gemmatimonas sp.]